MGEYGGRGRLGQEWGRNGTRRRRPEGEGVGRSGEKMRDNYQTEVSRYNDLKIGGGHRVCVRETMGGTQKIRKRRGYSNVRSDQQREDVETGP